MADSENKIDNSLSIQDNIHKYQCYSNRNHPLNPIICDHWFYPFTSSCQLAKVTQKNKFELDRPDHDSHGNRAERYLD